MKDNTHPAYYQATVNAHARDLYKRFHKEELRVDICSSCHPSLRANRSLLHSRPGEKFNKSSA